LSDTVWLLLTFVGTSALCSQQPHLTKLLLELTKDKTLSANAVPTY